jgi:hypothetical protein
MSRSHIILVGFLAGTLSASSSPVMGQMSQTAPRPATQSGTGPTPRVRAAKAKALRTPWGDPDLQGLWDFASLVPFERPAELADRPTLTGDEAAKFVQQQRSRSNRDNSADVPGQIVDFNEFWAELGPSGDNRTSLIVDPPNGRLPPLTPDAQRRKEALAAARRGVALHEPTPGGWIDEIGPGNEQVRCLVGVNSGPPMRPSSYNNHVRILQIPGYAVLLTEQIHDVRVVPLDGRAHGRIRQWAGDSRGRWDGETLVIDTINFRAPTIFPPLGSASMHLVERFTRVDDSTLLYRHTVEDPDYWTRPWTAELIMKQTKDQMYEFACHEGNYGLVHILSGARAKDADRAGREQE